MNEDIINEVLQTDKESEAVSAVKENTITYLLDDYYIVYADPVSAIPVTVTITQTPNQTIIVTYKGKDYTESFQAYYWDTITVRVEADEKYSPGTPSITSATLTGNITITATKAKTVNKWGTASLARARGYLAAAHVGNYVLFAGGYGDTSQVDSFNKSIVHGTPTGLSRSRGFLAGASTSNNAYALFAGGSVDEVTNVDAYSTSLVRSQITGLTKGSSALAGTTVGNYVLFGGGGNSSGSNTNFTSYARWSAMNAYNLSLVRTLPASLDTGSVYLAAANNDNYALFGGGNGGNNMCCAYNANLVKTTATTLSASRQWLAGSSTGNYALFGGGSSTNVVDAYNTSLVRTTPTTLSANTYGNAGTRFGDFALFSGGGTAIVDVYTNKLVHMTATSLSSNRSYLAAAEMNDSSYAFFGGGDGSAVVDVYEP